MGSCLTKKSHKEKHNIEGKKKKPSSSSDSRDPPSPEPLQVEEKVKEVLSETPNPPKPKLEADEEIQHFKKPDLTTDQQKNRSERRKQFPAAARSFSGELKRSSSNDRSVGVGCRSGRSSSPMPRQPQQQKTSVTQCEKFRRDHRERSARRSVSPAAKRVLGEGRSAVIRGQHCRSLSASRINVGVGGRSSPQRVREKERIVEKEEEESLENPLVSLECFIFL